MMIPVNRILRKNVWCYSDERFIAEITDNFDLWIHGIEKNHLTNSATLVDIPCFDDQDTNINDNTTPEMDRDLLSSECLQYATSTHINSSGDRGTIGRSNENIAESGEQNYSFSVNGSCSKLDLKNEICSHKIPKIMHFIWLGSEIPEQYATLMNTWRQCHESWDLKLWTDEGEMCFQLLFH